MKLNPLGQVSCLKSLVLAAFLLYNAFPFICQPSGEKQEILISLSYLPSAERLTVVLLKARNLHPPPNKETIGTSFHLILFHDFKMAGGNFCVLRASLYHTATFKPVLFLEHVELMIL